MMSGRVQILVTEAEQGYNYTNASLVTTGRRVSYIAIVPES